VALGESLFEIRRGDVAFPLDLSEGGELQPMPDSRRIDDLIGSGELESSLSRSGVAEDREGVIVLAVVCNGGLVER